MDPIENNKNTSSNVSEDAQSDHLVVVLSSDLKKLKCDRNLLGKRSNFFKKVFDCFDEAKNELVDNEIVPVIYLDYNMKELNYVKEFLETGEISSNSRSDIDKLIKINAKLEIEGFGEYLEQVKKEAEPSDDECHTTIDKTDETLSCDSNSGEEDSDESEEGAKCVDKPNGINMDLPVTQRVHRVLLNYRLKKNWKEFEPTNEILTPVEKQTLQYIQDKIFNNFRESPSKTYKMSLVYKTVKFSTEAPTKREATNNLILKVFQHIEASKNVTESQNGENNAQINIFTQYNFLERTKMMLNIIKTFDNILNQPGLIPPFLTPAEFQQIIYTAENARLTQTPNPAWPYYTVSFFFESNKIFGNGVNPREARDNMILGVVDYLTKKHLAQQRPIPWLDIPKNYNISVPWREKVKDLFNSINSHGISIDEIPISVRYHHLGIQFSFYADDQMTNEDPFINKIRDLTAKYALLKLFNEALNIDFPDPNDPTS